jgi:hypothetical protein
VFTTNPKNARAVSLLFTLGCVLVAVSRATDFDETDGVVCGEVQLDAACKVREFQVTFKMPVDKSTAALQLKFEAPKGFTGGLASFCGGIKGVLDQCHAGDAFMSCSLSYNAPGEQLTTFFAKLFPPKDAADCSGSARFLFEPIFGGNGTCVTPLAEIASCKDDTKTDPWPPLDGNRFPPDTATETFTRSSNSTDGVFDLIDIWKVPNGIGFVLVLATAGCLLLICLPFFVVLCCCLAAAKKKKNVQYARLTEEASDVPQVFTAK